MTSRCMTSGMMSSNTDDWATPIDFWTRLDKRFHSDLDVCASSTNAKCEKFYTKEQDGLRQPWTGRVWCNPPYGRELPAWAKKCAEYGAGEGSPSSSSLQGQTPVGGGIIA